jgi:pimeloyl-ACP methyl ester carboxylesterase
MTDHGRTSDENEKSTNGRAFGWGAYQAVRQRARAAQAQHVALAALSVLAPRRAEARAVELFARPQLNRMRQLPEVAGLRAVHSRVSFRDGSLSVSEWGHGPAVLLVHGWNGHAGQMTRFVAPLVMAGRRVVAFDQPAHGRSSGVRATLIDFAGAVRAVADAVGPLDAIVAHSLGATASALAVAWGLPASRLVLIAPPGNVPYFARAFAGQLGLSTARSEGMLVQLREQIGDLDALDLTKLAPGTHTEALVLHDRGDREVPFEHGAALARAWPGTRFIPLDGLGHARVLRDPGVVQLVSSFAASGEHGAQGIRPLRAA